MTSDASRSGKNIVIAIDGPAGAGKTTTAREVARRLGFVHLDTGAMYRAIALQVIRRKGDLRDSEEIVRIASSTDLSIRFVNGQQRVFLGDEDVTDEVRSPEVTAAVTPVCEIPGVRRLLVELQRQLGAQAHVVVEGRDIGTVVFPNADLKIYLTATLEERARRRLRDFSKTGKRLRYEDVAADLRKRDQRDAERADSPLKKADDAIEIDTTGLTLKEQVDKIIALYRRKVDAGVHL